MGFRSLCTRQVRVSCVEQRLRGLPRAGASDSGSSSSNGSTVEVAVRRRRPAPAGGMPPSVAATRPTDSPARRTAVVVQASAAAGHRVRRARRHSVTSSGRHLARGTPYLQDLQAPAAVRARGRSSAAWISAALRRMAEAGEDTHHGAVPDRPRPRKVSPDQPPLERLSRLMRSPSPVSSDQPLRLVISSVAAGRTECRSPTTPKSTSSKIGASLSLLTATMVFEVCMPARCWIAPEMPLAT